MTFYEVLEQVRELLQRHGRMSYRALKRQFELDDAYLEDLRAELVEVQRVAVDQDGTMLVWTGGAAATPAPAAESASGQARQPDVAPRAYMPAHLTDKILAARAALGLTPFVGRQQELEALHQTLAWAQTGHGQVVALVGEAGVGKSRLVYEGGRTLGSAHLWIRRLCLALGQALVQTQPVRVVCSGLPIGPPTTPSSHTQGR